MTTRDRIASFLDNEALFLSDEYDDAICGVADRCGMTAVVAYDRSRVIDILARSMSREDAEEFFEFNIAGAWVGEGTPMWIDTRWAE